MQARNASKKVTKSGKNLACVFFKDNRDNRTDLACVFFKTIETIETIS